MSRKFFLYSVGILAVLWPLYGQSDRGTITGTVTDQAGALVPGAPVIVANVATGIAVRTETTGTGNYTVPSLPAGTYRVSVEREGFRKFVQTGVTVQVAQTLRLDIALQVGSTADAVTVTADATLLRTESAEQSSVLNRDKINELPLNFAGAGAIRNPLMFVQLAPGTSMGAWNEIRVNGGPAFSFRITFEGQDATNEIDPRLAEEQQPSVEAIEEFTVQASNFSAEFGQVSGGLFNFTGRSGTNRVHGSLYENMVNEVFNAAEPFTDDGNGRKVKTRIRQNDFGGAVGGPVYIPKIYNGRDRTFFFFNYEKYRQIENRYDGLGTLPTTAYREGDFGYLLSGRKLNTDPLGRDIMDGTIYDPGTSRLENGLIVRNPFPENRIPKALFDPVAVKIQNMLPAIDARYANAPNNNFEKRFPNAKLQSIPSIKIDHSLSDAMKLSGYYSMQSTDKDNGRDGLPDPITQRRYETIRSYTARINYDWTIRPTLLNHLGLGFLRYNDPDSTPITDYDSVKELGLKGAVEKGFPRISGLMVTLGPSNYQRYIQNKPTVVENLTWIHASHAFKFGGQWRSDVYSNILKNGSTGTYSFSGTETGLPSTLGQSLGGGSIGNSYASFLLGLVNSATISNAAAPQYRRMGWAFFAQDDWKVTRRLTLNLGLRYDLEPAAHEEYYRVAAFDPTRPNPAAGNLPGAISFEGYGPGRCNCYFTRTYPYAFGPRLGAAYQLNSKTVLRAGWGLTYGGQNGFEWFGGTNYSLGFGWNSLQFPAPAFGDPAVVLKDGLSYDLNTLTAVNLDPGLRNPAGRLTYAPPHIDENAGRPPRINNWSIGIQREIANGMMIEAAYVGNRGAWFRADSLIDYNALTPERIRAAGLDINNPEDRLVLTSRLDSARAKARGFAPLYAGYPASATVAQSLRPFPQYTSAGSLWAPLGNTWYDSLQVKFTKRYSRGLDVTAAYTWSKNLATVTTAAGGAVPVNDVFNRRNQKTLSPYDQPHIFVAGFRYELPGAHLAGGHSLVRGILGGWNVSGIVRYASGFPIATPGSSNALSSLLFRSTRANRVAGEPLFLKDLNSHVDPNKDFVLNPKAWADPAAGQWGTAAAYYSDYRAARRPSEQLSFGKVTRIRESMSLEIRMEFFNIFNRLALPVPDAGNAFATQRISPTGVPESGFGRINLGNLGDRYFSNITAPRMGQLVARFRF